MLEIERSNHFSASSEILQECLSDMQEVLPEEESKSNIVKLAKTFRIFDQVLKQKEISY